MASYLTRYISRSRRGASTDDSDRQRVEWLILQLRISRLGAQGVDVSGEELDAIGPPAASFSRRRELYQTFSRYSGTSKRDEHIAWVDELVAVLEKLRDQGWQGLNEAEQGVVERELLPLLRRLRSRSARKIERDTPFAIV
jgi:hypothetical protein